MTKETVSDVQRYFQNYETLCKDAVETHNSLLKMPMLKTEWEQQQKWLAGKLKENNEFITDVKQWLSDAGVFEDGMSLIDTNVDPDDSVSNTSKQGSRFKPHSSSGSSKASSTASARLKAKAEKAALLQSVAALKKMHVLEAKEEDLQRQKEKVRREKEQLEMETQLAIATAKLSVLQTSEGSVERMSKEEDTMNAYYAKHVKSCSSIKCSNSKTSLQPRNGSIQQDNLVVRPKERSSMQTQAPASMNCKSSSARQQNVSSYRPEDNIQTPYLLPPQITAPVSAQDSTLYDIVQQQTNIAAQLLQQQALVSLPPRRILEFDGDPLQYGSFVKAFEQAIEKKTGDKQECLNYLEQYTRGRPRELVRSCHNMRADQGYDRAKNLLKEHFGSEIKVTAAYMEKVMRWPVIKGEDVDALESFSIFLRSCCNVMEDLQQMEEMNVPSNLRLIVMKLPYKFREKWRAVACDLQEYHGNRAKFSDLVRFIEHQVKILSHPLYGDLQSGQASSSFHAKAQPKSTSKGLTTVAAVHTVSQLYPSEVQHTDISSAQQKNINKLCIVCKGCHSLDRCSRLKNMTHREKLSVLKENLFWVLEDWTCK